MRRSRKNWRSLERTFGGCLTRKALVRWLACAWAARGDLRRVPAVALRYTLWAGTLRSSPHATHAHSCQCTGAFPDCLAATACPIPGTGLIARASRSLRRSVQSVCTAARREPRAPLQPRDGDDRMILRHHAIPRPRTARSQPARDLHCPVHRGWSGECVGVAAQSVSRGATAATPTHSPDYPRCPPTQAECVLVFRPDAPTPRPAMAAQSPCT